MDHEQQAMGPIGGDPALVVAPEAVAADEALAEQVAAHVRDMIIRGILRPGERIVERRLCLSLGVSRTPMREALKLLRQDSLVELSRNRGARVASYGAPEAESLFEVIAALESMAAARFSRLATSVLRARLEELHKRMLAQHQTRQLDDYFDTNSAIHDLIIDGADNPTLAESHRRLMLRARRGRYMAIMDEVRWEQAVQEHEALMATIRAGAAEAAGAVWREHLLNTGRSVVSVLQKSAPPSETGPDARA